MSKHFNGIGYLYTTCYDWKNPETVASADIGQHYEMDEVCIIEDEGKYHVVSCAGCSCVDSSDSHHDDGPFDTYEEALAAVPETHRSEMVAN